jgi:guanylate kinase
MKSTKRTKPLLTHLREFEKILDGYTPSSESLKTLQTLPLVLMVGPTAAGRNTLINLLTQTGRYHYIVSDTTRPPRLNNGILEQDGREYWFKTETEFLSGLQAGRYLEAAVIHRQQVSGISIAELERAAEADKIAIDEIEVVGAASIHAYKPNALFIFLLPPTFDIWMQRIRGRGDIDEDELRRRLESAQEEIAFGLSRDYYQFVVNYEIHEAAVAVDELANGRALDPQKQQIGRSHAEQLLIDVQLYLA